MSNLESARQAILAELDHANQGIAFYQARVTALEDALSKLDSIQGATERPPQQTSKASKGRPPAVADEPAETPAKTRGRPKRSDAALPSTGKDFWPNLITKEPQSAPQILAAAIKSLGIT